MIDTSRFAVSGRSERPVVAEAVIAAPVNEVFDAWTQSDRLSEWLGVPADVELRVGGSFEVYFDPDAPAGSLGSEDCQVLGYVPDEMLIVSWNSPPTLHQIRDAHTQVGIGFTAAGANTHLRLVHTGMGDDDVWDQNRAYFEHAWPMVMKGLSEYFA